MSRLHLLGFSPLESLEPPAIGEHLRDTFTGREMQVHHGNDEEVAPGN